MQVAWPIISAEARRASAIDTTLQRLASPLRTYRTSGITWSSQKDPIYRRLVAPDRLFGCRPHGTALRELLACHFPSDVILPHWTATLAEVGSFPLLAARGLPWHDRAVSGRDRARPEARLSRRGWIGVGALGGGVTLELANLLLLGGIWPRQTVRIFGPNAGVLILVVAGVISLAIGAFLGARAPSWPRFVRRLIAALLVASVGSAIGGSLSLFDELPLPRARMALQRS